MLEVSDFPPFGGSSASFSALLLASVLPSTDEPLEEPRVMGCRLNDMKDEGERDGDAVFHEAPGWRKRGSDNSFVLLLFANTYLCHALRAYGVFLFRRLLYYLAYLTLPSILPGLMSCFTSSYHSRFRSTYF